MVKNYLKIALRNIRKHPAYSFLNIAGLSIGLTCSIVIFLYVEDELTYDGHHLKKDRIYRATVTYYLPNNAGQEDNVVMGAPVAQHLVEDYPEVLQAVRFRRHENRLIQDIQNNRFFETIYFADSNLFDLFTFPLIQGDPKSALNDPYEVVVSKEMARKYFNRLDVVGEQLYLPEDSITLNVTGVLGDIPHNSHLKFDFVVSFETFRALGANLGSWWAFSTWSYLELDPEADIEAVGEKIKRISANYIANQEESSGYYQEYYLQKFTDIHLTSDLRGEIEPNSKKAYVYIFLIIGIAILIIACINFMNLSTARSAMRAKEIGIRKVSGAYRKQLINQFLGEAFLLSFLSLVISVILVQLALREVNDFMNKSLSFNLLVNPDYLLLLIGLSIIVTFIAGAYPALFLSAFKPSDSLKGTFRASSRGSTLRKVLVVLQFSVSVLLIGGTLVIVDQLNFMRQKNLGFEKDQVAYIPTRNSNNAAELFGVLKNEVATYSGVKMASLSGRVPGISMPNNVVRLGWGEDAEWSDMRFLMVDEEYIPLYDLELVAGRNFDKNRPSDVEEAFILNESGMNRLGWTNPEEVLGRPLRWQNRNGRVIGILKDFHFMSVNQAIQPFIMVMSGNRTPSYLSMKLEADDLQSSISFIRTKFNEVLPGNEFEYYFLDDEFDKQYKAEDRFMSLFTTFSVLAIIIACLGLYGLASFVAEMKFKEIGIRKVLGASSASVIILLNKDFTKLILIAVIIAIPLGYYGAGEWISAFPYKISVGIWKFLLAGMVSILIAWITVGYQSIKAAQSNPVDAIGNE